MMILAFPDYLSQAQRLAARLDAPLAEVELHRFPDGESLVRLPASLPEHVIVCRSLNQPNHKLVELMLCATTARELGAKRVTLVAPYLCYMRQDVANRPGEAVSQRIVGKLLAELFDDVLTVDPHLHRISSLDQAIPIKHAISLTAAEPIGAFLQRQFQHAVLMGPDSESKQWVGAIADSIGFDYVIAEKKRLGDKQVEMSLPPGSDFGGKPVVIVDDMASTGRTLAKAAGLLRAAGSGDIYVAVSHALFCDDAYEHILNAGIKAIWSTDSIGHSSSCIALDTLLAEAIKAIVR
ncbi:MAG: ribose-phosphate diphosphokinase [Methylobacter sp.]